MNIAQMKEYIRQYSSDQFYERVKKMPDSQVIAIYLRYVEKHNKYRQEVRRRNGTV